MSDTVTRGTFLTPDGWLAAQCRHQSTVHSVLSDATVDEAEPRFIPAPVDLHVHGGGGFDVMAGEEALRQMLVAQAGMGTGALLATSVAAPAEAIDAFLADVSNVMADPPSGGATLLGAHLEGPFINPNKLGAQPRYAAALNRKLLERWLSHEAVKVMTYAPEIDVDGVVPELARRYGVRAQLGHTLCSWAEAHAVMGQGVGVTHLFNAMSGFSHRDGGAAVAAMAFADHAEIITDGVHVDRASFEAARRAIPGLYSVTDGTAAAGMPDGPYRLGSIEVQKQGDRVLLSDGTLAGSCLTPCRSIEVLLEWGLDWVSIGHMLASIPAEWIGAQELGVIAPDHRAHWLELQADKPVALWLDGKRQALIS